MTIPIALQEHLRYAKKYTITNKYIVFYTGQSAIIYSRETGTYKKISNLKYTYQGYVSADEKHLLLVSNANLFYLVSLEDCTIVIKHTIGHPYIDGLEGRACWSQEKNKFYVPIQSRSTMLSTIREYRIGPQLEFSDYLCDKYWIIHISYVVCKQQYLAIGFDRGSHVWHFIWWKKNNEYTSYDLHDFQNAILDITVSEDHKQITIISEVGIHCFDFTGKVKDKIGTFDSVELKNILTDQSLDPFCVKCCLVSLTNPNLVYVGTINGLLLVDMSLHSVIKDIKIEFGVHNISEIEDGMLIVETWSGLKILEI